MLANCNGLSSYPVHASHASEAEASLREQAANSMGSGGTFGAWRSLDGDRTVLGLFPFGAKTVEAFFRRAPRCPRGGTPNTIGCIQVGVKRLGGAWPSLEMNETCKFLIPE